MIPDFRFQIPDRFQALDSASRVLITDFLRALSCILKSGIWNPESFCAQATGEKCFRDDIC